MGLLPLAHIALALALYITCDMQRVCLCLYAGTYYTDVHAHVQPKLLPADGETQSTLTENVLIHISYGPFDYQLEVIITN